VSQVNLLPPELRKRQATRRTTALVATIGGVLVGAIVLFFLVQSVRLSSAQSDLAAQQQKNANLQSEINQLQPYADQQAELKTKQDLVASVYVGEVAWSGVLLDVSRVIPDEQYLTSMAGQLTAPTGTAAPAPATGATELIGNITFSGVADGTATISTWLTRLEDVQGWVNPWAGSASETGPFTGIYSFDSSVDLTMDAATDRGQGQLR
jgi:Tfp pilus assembly protein PilN